MKTETLNVFNPSSYPRLGNVTVAWKPVHEATLITPEKLVIHDGQDPLPAQVDRIDPADPARDELSFRVEHLLEPGNSEYQGEPVGRLALGEGGLPAGSVSGLEVTPGAGGFKLVNRRLSAWFNVQAAPWEPGRNWFGGAATSILLDGGEMLDFNDMWGHDPEKRGLQPDWLELARPAWDPEPLLRVPLFDRDYEIMAKSVGPVRAFVTLASAPFDYDYTDSPGGKNRRLSCRLYRVLSLFADADYLSEDFYVKGVPPEAGSGAQATMLTFRLGYFAYMRWSGGMSLSRFEHIPDWFAVSSRLRPFLGYAFATDVHASQVIYPAPKYPDYERATNALSWRVDWSRGAKCAHSFLRLEESDASAEGAMLLERENQRAAEIVECCKAAAGRRWYESIYKPLRAAQ